jgi:hypothetical protein
MYLETRRDDDYSFMYLFRSSVSFAMASKLMVNHVVVSVEYREMGNNYWHAKPLPGVFHVRSNPRTGGKSLLSWLRWFLVLY